MYGTSVRYGMYVQYGMHNYVVVRQTVHVQSLCGVLLGTNNVEYNILTSTFHLQQMNQQVAGIMVTAGSASLTLFSIKIPQNSQIK